MPHRDDLHRPRPENACCCCSDSTTRNRTHWHPYDAGIGIVGAVVDAAAAESDAHVASETPVAATYADLGAAVV